MEIRLYQVDAFTTELFSGNPAGVVTNAEHLDASTMQKIAREMNLSETAFIINNGSEDYDVEVRFFTPTTEVPICGHATISAHYVYAREQNIKKGTIYQKTKAGILPVEIIGADDDIRVSMTQAEIVFGKILTGDEVARLLNGLGIGEADLIDDLPVQIVSTGHSKVMVPLKSKSVLDDIHIKADVLTTLSSDIGCNGFYTFTFNSREEGILTSGRMFAPAIGINEDPVTGNANGPLGAYLVKYGRAVIAGGKFGFSIKQGEAIGRKGYMNVSVLCSDGEPESVKITGSARIVFETKVNLWKL